MGQNHLRGALMNQRRRRTAQARKSLYIRCRSYGKYWYWIYRKARYRAVILGNRLVKYDTGFPNSNKSWKWSFSLSCTDSFNLRQQL